MLFVASLALGWVGCVSPGAGGPRPGVSPAPVLAELHEGVIVLDPALLLAAAPEWLSTTGNPQIVGDAVRFDGVDDGIFLERTPLAGLEEFTVEVVFKQGIEASLEPRFLHIGEVSGGRMMLETRITEDRQHWVLDSYFRAGPEFLVLIDYERIHPVNEWAHIAVVMNRGRVKNYVNGHFEMEGELPFHPIDGGRTSIGMRMNKVHWFNGEIRHIRITPRALLPGEFTLLK